jgi:hypothetical protein
MANGYDSEIEQNAAVFCFVIEVTGRFARSQFVFDLGKMKQFYLFFV